MPNDKKRVTYQVMHLMEMLYHLQLRVKRGRVVDCAMYAMNTKTKSVYDLIIMLCLLGLKNKGITKLDAAIYTVEDELKWTDMKNKR